MKKKNADKVDLDDVADSSLALTKTFIDDIKIKMGPKGKHLASMEPQEYAKLASMLTMLMRASALVIKESRSLEKDAREAAEKLSYDEKRAMIVEFIRMLPPEHTQAMRNELGWN